MSASRILRPFERLGAQAEGVLAYMGGIGYLTLDTARQTVLGVVRRPRIKVDETFFQMVRLGVRAIPIVVLVQFFVGMTLAFTLAPVLADYGQLGQLATVVAKAVFPQLGPLLAAVVLTGFAGAAITAELGTMAVGEEIRALEISAIDPVRFLVVPRVVAVMLMTLALTVLSNIVGTLGGLVVSTGILGIDPYQYYHTALEALLVKDVATGLIKGGIYGAIIVLVACYEGLSVGGDAASVGVHTTASVVRSIFLIIVANCAFTAIFFFIW